MSGKSHIFGDFQLLNKNCSFYDHNRKENFPKFRNEWKKGISPIIGDFERWTKIYIFFMIRTSERV